VALPANRGPPCADLHVKWLAEMQRLRLLGKPFFNREVDDGKAPR
jgi:hypothetical protein